MPCQSISTTFPPVSQQATGSIRLSWQSFKNMMAQQAGVALLLGGGLSVGGFVRVSLRLQSHFVATVAMGFSGLYDSSGLHGIGSKFVAGGIGQG